MSDRCRVLCIDDSNAVTSVLAKAIGDETDLEVAGVANCADGLLARVEACHPDVVVLDLMMGGESPLTAIEALSHKVPWCSVVAYSSQDDPLTIGEVTRRGGRFVSKFADFRELLVAIRLAASESRAKSRPA